VVPDLGGGREPDLLTSVQQLPAEVDIITGRRKERVEPAHLHEDGSLERHVAARYVLSPVVSNQDFDRVARALGDRPLDQSNVLDRQIGTAGPDHARFLQRKGQVVGPMWMTHCVGVEERHDLADSCRTRKGNLAAMAAVSSVEPSSQTTTSRPG
jgi:hypothetical protein